MVLILVNSFPWPRWSLGKKKANNLEFVNSLWLIFLASQVLGVMLFFCVTTTALMLTHFLAAN